MLSSRARLRESSQNARARAHLSFFFAFFLFLPFCNLPPPSPCPEKKCRGEGSTTEEERRDVRKRRTNARTRRSISFPLVSTLPLHLSKTRIFSSTHNECARETPSRRKKKKTRNPNECKKCATRDDANVLRAHAFYREMYSMHVHETMPFSKISFVDVVDVVGVSHC